MNSDPFTPIPPAVTGLLTRMVQQKRAHATRHYHSQSTDIPGRSPYVCIGCLEWPEVKREGMKMRTIKRKITEDERRLVFACLLVPQQRQQAEAALGKAFTVQAYFPQAYEAGVNGPGGVIGIIPLGEADTRASTALKMWLWQTEATHFPYVADEGEAAQQLWAEAQRLCPNGLQWLSQQTGAVGIPAALRNELHTLLGVPALATLVAQHTGRPWGLETLERLTLTT